MMHCVVDVVFLIGLAVPAAAAAAAAAAADNDNDNVANIVENTTVAVGTTNATTTTTTTTNTQSLLVALGRFWFAEQSFEQYGPGVIEAISGYAGGIHENPTSRHHPGHYEVIEIQYDPSKTSYTVLVAYAYRNMDPFNGHGQFCNSGPSYQPAIFYGTDAERDMATTVFDKIVEAYGWDRTAIVAPILPRPTDFWKADEDHQDYYIKKPRSYGLYKLDCGRAERLQEVWGVEAYSCYHDPTKRCFGGKNATVINTKNETVLVEVNVKATPHEFIHPLALIETTTWWHKKVFIGFGIAAGAMIVVFFFSMLFIPSRVDSRGIRRR